MRDICYFAAVSSNIAPDSNINEYIKDHHA
jgi:hypothetical protein